MQQSYLPHVDGLRGLAIALVLAYHAWPAAVTGGYIGVDVFFVISGFIITRRIYPEITDGSFSIPGFIARRIRRLMPAAAVCLALTSIAAILLLSPEALVEFGQSLSYTGLLAANVHFYETSGYFAAPSAQKPLLHIWSLSIEDQFYLIWPLALLGLSCLVASPRIVAGLLVLAAFASLGLSEARLAHDPDYSFFWLLPRAFELLTGAALAVASASTIGLRALPGFDAAGLALVAASAYLLTPDSHFPGLAALPACVGTALLISSGLTRQSLITAAFGSRPATALGKISYSLYLYHWPILALAAYAVDRPLSTFEAAACAGLALVAGTLSWMVVEQWATDRLLPHDGRLQPAFVLAAVVTMAMLGTGSFLQSSEGLPNRLAEIPRTIYAEAATSNPWQKRCDGTDKLAASGCAFGAPGDGPVTLAILGDSNADHIVPLMDELTRPAGLRGRQLSQSKCAPLFGIARGHDAREDADCARYQEALLDLLSAPNSLKTIVLAGAWARYQSSVTVNRIGERIGLGKEGESVTFAEAARHTVKLLRDKGFEVIVFGQLPVLPRFSIRCYAEAAGGTRPIGQCVTPLSSILDNQGTFETSLAALPQEFPGVRYVSLIKTICDAETCNGLKDGVFLYRNAGHLSGAGSRHLARYLDLKP